MRLLPASHRVGRHEAARRAHLAPSQPWPLRWHLQHRCQCHRRPQLGWPSQNPWLASASCGNYHDHMVLLLSLIMTSSTSWACSVGVDSGLVSPRWGEVPQGGAVVLDDGYEPGPLWSDELQYELLSTSLPDVYHVPPEVVPGSYTLDIVHPPSSGNIWSQVPYEVVTPDEWPTGTFPDWNIRWHDVQWDVVREGCPPLPGHWELFLAAEIQFNRFESDGWFLRAHDDGASLAYTAVEGFFPDGYSQEHRYSLDDPSWTDRRYCPTLDLYDGFGVLQDSVDLDCKRAPLKPPWPACSVVSASSTCGLTVWAFVAVWRRQRRHQDARQGTHSYRIHERHE